MQSLIRHQVEAFERTAIDLRARFVDHAGGAPSWAEFRTEIEGMMDLLVVTFDSLGRTVERFQDEAPNLMTDGTIADFHDLFSRLSTVFTEVMSYGRAAEAAGCAFPTKSDFLRAWRELQGIAAIDPSSLEQSFHELRTGAGKSLGDFAEELSRDPIG
jgi:hypothetical protein